MTRNVESLAMLSEVIPGHGLVEQLRSELDGLGALRGSIRRPALTRGSARRGRRLNDGNNGWI